MTSRYQVNYQLRSHKRDQFIEFIKTLLLTPFVLVSAKPQKNLQSQDAFLEVFGHLEVLIEEHRSVSYCPSIGHFFTTLPLKDAFLVQDEQYHISQRKMIPPSFNDIRRILNCSQVKSIAGQLKLLTFDGDVTLYEDGGNLKRSSPLVDMIIRLLLDGIYVAIVTAAGYLQPERYEQRLGGLIEGIRESHLSPHLAQRLFVLGGECNYLMRLEGPECRLRFLEQQPDHLYTFEEKDISEFLDIAELSLSECAERLQLSAKIIRKDRAVGLIPSVSSMPSLVVNDPSNVGSSAAKPLLINYRIEREQLDECVLATQRYLVEHYTKAMTSSMDTAVPAYCVFNGGRDVWVDIGNKLIGVQYLQRLLKSEPEHTLHVGDQFLSTGNDIATRSACATIWIVSPIETEQILSQLIADRQAAQQ